jgi:hypothetical protein
VFCACIRNSKYIFPDFAELKCSSTVIFFCKELTSALTISNSVLGPQSACMDTLGSQNKPCNESGYVFMEICSIFV